MEVLMNKILLAMFVCVFSVTALACDGTGKGKSKEKEEEKRFETVTAVIN